MAVIEGYSEEIYQTFATAIAKLGTKLDFPDGRRFRFAQNGLTALVAGRIVQSTVPQAQHLNLTVVAAQGVGDHQVTVTLGSTAVVANEYAEGFLYVNDAGADTTTEGYTYRIKSHPAAAASGNVVITLYEDSPICIALTTNSQVTLTHNKFYAVIVHPSPPTGQVVGLAPCAVPISYYFWCQTRGPAAVITEGTVVIAQEVMCSSSVDGAVTPAVLTEATPNTFITPPVGICMTVNVTTEESLIDLKIE